MARTILSSSRLAETRDPNLGKIIIFCEGDTEKYYFDYFVEIIEKEKKAGKYTDIHIETESANGNARRVFKYANEYLSNDDNSRRFGLYAKYLTFDCDAPQDIQNVIMDARDHGGYVLLLTNHLFETWLLIEKRPAVKQSAKVLSVLGYSNFTFSFLPMPSASACKVATVGLQVPFSIRLILD